jgi:hypothetical protein
MKNETKALIETYLRTIGTWVPAADICATFHVTERQLRQVGEEEGLCSGFAISGDKGFKHVSLATTGEWLHFKHRLRKHGIQELCRVRDLDKRRHEVTRTVHNIPFEKDTGQGLLFQNCSAAQCAAGGVA